MQGKRPLNGIRVIDLCAYLAGPFTTMMMGGLGAEVITIERPSAGDPNRTNPPYVGPGGISGTKPLSPEDTGASMAQRGRCKKYISLDLKTEEGKGLLKQLVADADVLVENFSARVMEDLNLGYDVLSKVNPGLIYCSISGFGHSGPYKDRLAFDTIIQAMSGIMDISGPPRGASLSSSLAMGDLTAPLFAVIGILAAIREKRKSGLGQAIDISMQDCLFSMVFDEALDVFLSLGMELRRGNSDYRLFPQGVYACDDGLLAVAVEDFRQWSKLCRVLGLEDEPSTGCSERFEDRARGVQLTDSRLKEWLKGKKIDQAVETLRAGGIPCAPVLSMDEVVNEPQVISRQTVVDIGYGNTGPIDGLKGSGLPIKFSDSNAQFDVPASPLGHHNMEVYSDLLGLSRDELEALSERGVI